MPKPKFKWTLEIEIDPIWVADGYEATADNVKDAILVYSLQFANDNEIKVKTIKKPNKKDIEKAQGYSERRKP